MLLRGTQHNTAAMHGSAEPLLPTATTEGAKSLLSYEVGDGHTVLMGHMKLIFDSDAALSWHEHADVCATPTNNAHQIIFY